MSTPLQPGAIARITTSHEHFGHKYCAGDEFRVEDYVTAEQAEDGVAFYYGSTKHGINDVDVDARYVEQVMSAEDASNRQLPTVTEVMNAVSSELCGLYGDGFTTHATDRADDHTVVVTGETEDGLDFAFTVVLTKIESVME